jgi:hypothetical protein
MAAKIQNPAELKAHPVMVKIKIEASQERNCSSRSFVSSSGTAKNHTDKNKSFVKGMIGTETYDRMKTAKTQSKMLVPRNGT